MKFSKWILGAALLFSTQVASVQGKNACEPCDPCALTNPCDMCDMDLCDIKFDVYVDALYWQVCKGDLNLGRDSSGTQKYMTPEFSWGYRVAGKASWRNWDLGVRWTSLTNSTSSSYATIDYEKAKFHFDARVLDVEMGYTCCVCNPFIFRPFVGGKFAWIKDHYNKYSGGYSDSKIENEGYGLYIGACGRWELCTYQSCDWNVPISLVTRASAGVLRSQFSQKVRVEIDTVEEDRNLNWEHIFTPYSDVYVGLDFQFNDMCGWDAFFQVGYEAQSYGWRQYNDFEAVTYLGMGGLVLRFGADF